MVRKFLLLATLLTVAACAPLARRPQPPPAPVPPAPAALPAPGRYRIEPERSELRVLVFRAGALAHLGHNHVIVNRGLSGEVTVGEAWQDCSFSLNAAVADFVVDDPEARRGEGADFPPVPDDAKAGTLRNMRSASVLNADGYPQLAVQSVAVSQSEGVLTARMTVQVAGHEASISAPFSVNVGEQELEARAEFELKQSDIGMVPYSLMGGALAVQDAMRVKITLRALK